MWPWRSRWRCPVEATLERQTQAASASKRQRRDVGVAGRAQVATSTAASGANGERAQDRAPANPPAWDHPWGRVRMREGVLAWKKYGKSVCGTFWGPGGHLGLRAAQDCRSGFGSAMALRPKMPSSLTNARSLSPETVRRGGKRDRCGNMVLRGSNPVTTQIVRRVSRKHFAVLDRGSDQRFRHK